MFETGYLHIGTEKTGTKSIQAFLRTNHDDLRIRGILYPVSLGPHNHRKLRNFAAGSHDHVMGAEVRNHPGGVAGFRTQLEEEFRHEIADCGCSTLIVSDEHFQSCLTSREEIRRLHDFLRPWCKTIRVVVYLRRQDRLCLSFQSEYIKTGHSDDVPLNAQGIHYYYDYRSLIQNYESVFGVGNVIVRIFEPKRLLHGDVVEDFAAVTEFSTLGLRKAHRRNVSLSELGLKYLAEFNRHVPFYLTDGPNPVRTDMRAWLEQNFSGFGWPVSREWAIDFYRRYQDINEWIRVRFFPSEHSLFSEDFSEYPPSAAGQNFEFADAVRVAAVLWRQQAQALLAARLQIQELQAAIARRDRALHDA